MFPDSVVSNASDLTLKLLWFGPAHSTYHFFSYFNTFIIILGTYINLCSYNCIYNWHTLSMCFYYIPKTLKKERKSILAQTEFGKRTPS